MLAGHNGYGQTNQRKSNSDEKNVPQSNITVNKEYDENGNLIRYDSTYSWSYSNIRNDTLVNDTIIYGNKEFFDRKDFFPDIPFFDDEDFFNDRFFSDSLFADRSFFDDFFNEKFFGDKFFGDNFSGDSIFFHGPGIKDFSPDQSFMNRERMEKMFRQIDSLHSEFFKRNFNYPLQPGEENKQQGKQM